MQPMIMQICTISKDFGMWLLKLLNKKREKTCDYIDEDNFKTREGYYPKLNLTGRKKIPKVWRRSVQNCMPSSGTSEEKYNAHKRRVNRSLQEVQRP
jgi:hypothetical protein